MALMAGYNSFPVTKNQLGLRRKAGKHTKQSEAHSQERGPQTTLRWKLEGRSGAGKDGAGWGRSIESSAPEAWHPEKRSPVSWEMMGTGVLSAQRHTHTNNTAVDICKFFNSKQPSFSSSRVCKKKKNVLHGPPEDRKPNWGPMAGVLWRLVSWALHLPPPAPLPPLQT